MSITLSALPSRFGFFICGLITFAVGRVFAAMLHLGFTASAFGRSESVVLTLVAAFTVLIAFAPSSWIGEVCRIDTTNQGSSSTPIKMLGSFAGIAYVVTVGLQLIPPGRHQIDPRLVFLVCPACALTLTVDPSLGTVLVLLAPLNAAVYGAFGGTLGYIVLAIRNRWAMPT
jgi:hypothetical protein